MTNKKANAVVPLTLAQLGQMDGQPVYIQILQTGEGRWGLLESVGECVVGVLMPDGKKSYHLIDLYGKTWTAYAYPPPAHIDREAWEPCKECTPRCAHCVSYDAWDTLGEPDICKACENYSNYLSEDNFCSYCGRPLTPKAWAELEKRLRG